MGCMLDMNAKIWGAPSGLGSRTTWFMDGMAHIGYPQRSYLWGFHMRWISICIMNEFGLEQGVITKYAMNECGLE